MSMDFTLVAKRKDKTGNLYLLDYKVLRLAKPQAQKANGNTFIVNQGGAWNVIEDIEKLPKMKTKHDIKKYKDVLEKFSFPTPTEIYNFVYNWIDEADEIYIEWC